MYLPSAAAVSMDIDSSKTHAPWADQPRSFARRTRGTTKTQKRTSPRQLQADGSARPPYEIQMNFGSTANAPALQCGQRPRPAGRGRGGGWFGGSPTKPSRLLSPHPLLSAALRSSFCLNTMLAGYSRRFEESLEAFPYLPTVAPALCGGELGLPPLNRILSRR